jgi:L-amino acid N-acyltransferase YncA
MILDRLIEDAKKLGVTSILACISSQNQPSLDFHRKKGFQECGALSIYGERWAWTSMWCGCKGRSEPADYKSH